MGLGKNKHSDKSAQDQQKIQKQYKDVGDEILQKVADGQLERSPGIYEKPGELWDGEPGKVYSPFVKTNTHTEYYPHENIPYGPQTPEWETDSE